MPTTFISFAMGWTSVVRQPMQMLIRIVGVENKNYGSIYNVKLITVDD
ncbi:MAG TPA: hypothetical protein VEA37_08655 [Flavobacterium sp.]|nr:hypothetical protein [Flavobacterium sp.]